MVLQCECPLSVQKQLRLRHVTQVGRQRQRAVRLFPHGSTREDGAGSNQGRAEQARCVGGGSFRFSSCGSEAVCNLFGLPDLLDPQRGLRERTHTGPTSRVAQHRRARRRRLRAYGHRRRPSRTPPDHRYPSMRRNSGAAEGDTRHLRRHDATHAGLGAVAECGHGPFEQDLAGHPASSVRSAPSSRLLARSCSPSRRTNLPRRSAGTSRQAPKAWVATPMHSVTVSEP